MSRRQYLRQIARQSLGEPASWEDPAGGSSLRPLVSLCKTLPHWAEAAATHLIVGLDQIPDMLSEEQKWGSAIAAAVAAGNPQLMQAVLRDADGRITHQTRDLARATAVAALLAHGPNLNEGSNPNGGLSPQDLDAPGTALFALAAAAARTTQVAARPWIEAARDAGTPDTVIDSVLGIAHAFAVAATILNGRASPDASHGPERLRVS